MASVWNSRIWSIEYCTFFHRLEHLSSWIATKKSAGLIAYLLKHPTDHRGVVDSSPTWAGDFFIVILPFLNFWPDIQLWQRRGKPVYTLFSLVQIHWCSVFLSITILCIFWFTFETVGAQLYTRAISTSVLSSGINILYKNYQGKRHFPIRFLFHELQA